MLFYSADAKNYSFHLLLPNAGLMIPFYLFPIIHKIWNEFNTIHLIDKQRGHCDDIAYSLALSHYFNEPYLKIYRDKRGKSVCFIDYMDVTKQTLPNFNISLEKYQQIIMNNKPYKEYTFNNFDKYIPKFSVDDTNGLSNFKKRMDLRTECLNLMIYQFMSKNNSIKIPIQDHYSESHFNEKCRCTNFFKKKT